jgi:ATP-dependent phosphoenolpyruvate carboxykinase
MTMTHAASRTASVQSTSPVRAHVNLSAAELIELAIARGEGRLAANGALEYEFFVFQETPESVREKGFRNLRPLTPDMMGY